MDFIIFECILEENNLRKHIFIGLVALFSSIILSTYVAMADSGTHVKGVIEKDTVWNKEQGPYIIDNNILIESGVTLTINEGVEVLVSGGYKITAIGNLFINGTEKERVSFNSIDERFWYGIVLLSDNNRVTFAELTNVGHSSSDTPAIAIRSASNNIIENTKISDSNYGIEIFGNYTYYDIGNNIVKDSVITNSFYGGIKVSYGNGDQIINNEVSGKSFFTAISADGKNLKLIGNNVHHNEAVGMSAAGENLEVIGNEITNNKKSGLGISGTTLRIYGNNIYQNGSSNGKYLNFSVYGDYKQTVDISNNYWGTMNEKEINDNLVDFKDGIAPKTNIFPYLIKPVDISSVTKQVWYPITEVASNKVWTIKFNSRLDSSSVNDSNIYILDEKGDKVPISIKINGDSSSVSIEPKSDYIIEESYFLHITKDVKSIGSINIKQPIKKKFS